MGILRYKLILVLQRLKMTFLFSIFGIGVVAQNNIEFIEKVQKYQDSVKLKRTGEFPDLIDTSTFNINKYLNYFDKLNLPTGSKCYCVFEDSKLHGSPILYLKNDSLDIGNYIERKFEEYIKRHNIGKSKITREFIDFQKHGILCGFALIYNANKYIIPEDNEAGYLQFLFFKQFGDQFALKWHSYYGQKSIIFSNSEMERLFNYYSTTDLFSCAIENFESLLEINPEPIIELRKDKCVITWYEIRTHFGIHKMTYEISRFTPYTIEKKEDIKILDINMEFIY